MLLSSRPSGDAIDESHGSRWSNGWETGRHHRRRLSDRFHRSRGWEIWATACICNLYSCINNNNQTIDFRCDVIASVLPLQHPHTITASFHLRLFFFLFLSLSNMHLLPRHDCQLWILMGILGKWYIEFAPFAALPSHMLFIARKPWTSNSRMIRKIKPHCKSFFCNRIISASIIWLTFRLQTGHSGCCFSVEGIEPKFPVAHTFIQLSFLLRFCRFLVLQKPAKPVLSMQMVNSKGVHHMRNATIYPSFHCQPLRNYRCTLHLDRDWSMDESPKQMNVKA